MSGTPVAHDPYLNPDAWTTDAVRDEIAALIPTVKTPQEAVTAIMGVLNRHGYDSVDRELSFDLASKKLGLPYDDFYDAWLAGHRSGR